MYAVRNGGMMAVRLAAGEDVHASLIKACAEHDISGCFIVSGIGMLADPQLGYFITKGEYARKEFPGRFELLNLSGNIAAYQDGRMAHLHAMLADEEYNVFGGHLFESKVGLTLELMLSIADPIKLYRQYEEESGLPGLLVD